MNLHIAYLFNLLQTKAELPDTQDREISLNIILERDGDGSVTGVL